MREAIPLIAVVRLRKRNEWVLPKGKLDDGETPRAAAEREVLEETGHDVSVHEFLGTLVYDSGGRSKVVHYWRMESCGEQVYELMDDVRAVDWLPLEAAVERLSRGHERAFLANVGPLALEASALARVARQPKATKLPVPEKRRRARPVAPPASSTMAVPAAPPDPMPPAIEQDEPWFAGSSAVEAETPAAPAGFEPPPHDVEAEVAAPAPASGNDTLASTARGGRPNLMRKVRDWLRRAA